MMEATCLLILSFAGLNYLFGLYSLTIKVTLGYDQEMIDTLDFLNDLGANVALLRSSSTSSLYHGCH